MKIDELLNESASYIEIEAQYPLTKGEYADYVECLENLKSVLTKHQVDDTSIPAAPNTSSFRAGVSGKVELVTDYVMHGDYYTPTSSFRHFLKIGSGIPRDVVKREVDNFMDMIGDVIARTIPQGVKNIRINFDNNLTLVICKTVGTNFSGIGFSIEKRSN